LEGECEDGDADDRHAGTGHHWAPDIWTSCGDLLALQSVGPAAPGIVDEIADEIADAAVNFSESRLKP
jgi:hypothetical protein